MADIELVLRLSAKTDEFVNTVEAANTRVRSLSMQMAGIDKQLKTESDDRIQKLREKPGLTKCLAKLPDEEAVKYGKKCKIVK